MNLSVKPTRVNIWLKNIAFFCIISFVFLSNAFLFIDVFFDRIFLQIILSIPIIIYFFTLFISNKKFKIDGLFVYLFFKLIIEVVLRGNVGFILEIILLLFVIYIITNISESHLNILIKHLSTILTFFASFALLQWFVSFFFTDYIKVSMSLDEHGVLSRGDNNLFTYFGFFSEKQYPFFNHITARHFSFAKEPSLILVYFFFTAVILFLYNKKKFAFNIFILFLFSILSFSGSVFLAILVAFIIFVISYMVPFKFIYPLGVFVLFIFFLLFVTTTGIDIFLIFFSDLGTYNPLLSKTSSISDRILPSIENLLLVFKSPFGTKSTSDATGPWLINIGISTGWIGIILFLFFLVKIGKVMHKYLVNFNTIKRIEVSLILAPLIVFIIFNDYQMNSYSGILLISLLYRVLQFKNLVI